MQIFMKFREEENKIYIVFPTIKLKHYVYYIYIFCFPFNIRMYTCMHIMLAISCCPTKDVLAGVISAKDHNTFAEVYLYTYSEQQGQRIYVQEKKVSYPSQQEKIFC